MIPDIQTQLAVVIKSLKDNVAPAVDPENRLAQEQLFLSLASLEIALSHLPVAHQYVRRDISDHIDLATILVELCVAAESKSQLTEAVSQGNKAMLNPAMGFTQLQTSARNLRDVIGVVIAVEADADAAEAIERAVLKASGAAVYLGRAWNKPMGFEPRPDDVVELLEQLKA